ncbi:MAG: branched-chain amino acid ABC transporter permease [Gemmataceae bacterium]|nr:branched-chain amino acid ABC transporter permease [Gemmataceae bacterium]
MQPILADGNGGALFWELLVNGLVMGSLFALIALGYSLVYGIIELVNFAHGDLFMLGAAMTYTLTALAVSWFGTVTPGGMSFAIVLGLLLIVPFFCGGANILIDRAVYRPLRRAPRLVPLVSALGVSFVLVNIGQLWIGTSPLSLENKAQLVSDDSLIQMGEVPLKWKDAVVLITVVPVMVGLTWLVKFTRLGKAMRATAQNLVAAQLMGIGVERVIASTFFVGGYLAGLAAVVYTLKIGRIEYQMGFQNGLYAFTAAVVGGIGNIPGAVLGGLLLGFIYSFGGGYSQGNWVDALIFGVLIVLLIFRPTGLLGSRSREKV